MKYIQKEEEKRTQRKRKPKKTGKKLPRLKPINKRSSTKINERDKMTIIRDIFDGYMKMFIFDVQQQFGKCDIQVDQSRMHHLSNKKVYSIVIGDTCYNMDEMLRVMEAISP
jgi:hypothetical protein